MERPNKIRNGFRRTITLIKLYLNPEEKIKLMIVNGRKDEKERVTKVWTEKYNEMLKRLERDNVNLSQEKDAKIESLLEEMEEKDVKIKNVEDIFNFCWDQTKANMQLASDLKVQVWRAQKNQSDTYKSMIIIVDKADEYMVEMKKKESKFKELLGWKSI